ncbi:hypothetical protein ACHAPU_006227 [Fusarium lateritium]
MSKWTKPESHPARMAPYARMSISSTRLELRDLGQSISEAENDCTALLAEIDDFFQSEGESVGNTNRMDSLNLGETLVSQDASCNTDELLELLTGDNSALRSQIDQLLKERNDKHAEVGMKDWEVEEERKAREEFEIRVQQLEKILYQQWKVKDVPSPETKIHIEKLQQNLEVAEGQLRKEAEKLQLHALSNAVERNKGRKQLESANSQIVKLQRELERTKLRLQREAKKNRDQLTLPGVAKQLEVEQQLLLANSEIQMLKDHLYGPQSGSGETNVPSSG